jgi:hypothetical protein
MSFRNAVVAVMIQVEVSAAASLAMATGAGHNQVFAQAVGQHGEHLQGPHFDPTQGDGLQPHNPQAPPQQVDGPSAYFGPTQGDGLQPRRPGAVSRQVGRAPAYFGSTQGDGLQPHALDRGPPQPGR